MGARLRLLALVFQLHLKQTAVDAFVIFVVIIQPLIVALLALYMLRNSPGFQAIYVVVGSGLTGLWSTTLYFSALNIDFERTAGTLEAIVASPTGLSLVVAGKSIANTTLSLCSMLVSYIVASTIFGFGLSIGNPVVFSVSLILTVFAMIALGLVIAPLMALNIGSTVWANACEHPMYILGGFLFSILILPNWTHPISFLLAPYWAARALHDASTASSSFSDVLLSWGTIVGLSIAYLGIALWLFNRLLRKARVEATLGLK